MSGGWLEDFVKSLGHRIMYSMPRGQGIQEVHSKTPPRGKTIRGNPKHSRETYWWTLDRDYLDQMSKEEFYDLHMAIFDSKAYRKIVFLTNPSTSAKTAGTTSQTSRKIVLSAVSDCTVHDLPGPAIILPKMTLGRRSSVPPPVPFLRPPEIEPWNEIEDPIISHIPWTGGQGPWGCPYVILVEPEVDCAEAAKRGFSWKLPAEMAPAEYRDKRDGFMSPWADEKELAWNEAALALYRRRGYLQVGIRKGYYADNGEDALVLSRELPAAAAEDLLATAAGFVAQAVAWALEREAPTGLERLVVAGGGVHHVRLMRELEERTGLVVESSAVHGVDPDAREALGFAALAAGCGLGWGWGAPEATGGARGRVLGRLSPPPT